MRPFLVASLALVFVAAAFAPRPACAASVTSIDLAGTNLAFYSDRFVLNADDVRVRLSDGTVIRGETFAMDLKSNRFVIAGNVRLDGTRIHRTGAAFASFIDVDRSYLITDTDEPDRLTYFGSNWIDDHPGREQPGDAFAFPDVGADVPYILAKSARIYPATDAVFEAPRILVAGVRVPQARYVVVFSANPHFFENAFSGGRVDVGLPLNGSEHSLTAFHIRNDQLDGTYLSFDQHLVWDHDWVVGSINPLTQNLRQYNVIGLKSLGTNVQFRSLLQETAQQFGTIIYQPVNAAGYVQTQVNAGLRGAALSVTNDFYYWWLLGINADPDPRHLEHPVDGVATLTGFEHRLLLGSVPFTYRLRGGIGWAHDQFGEGGYLFLNPAPPDLWYRFAGITLAAPELHLMRGYILTVSTDKQITSLPPPHKIDVVQTRATLSHHFAHADTFLAYQVVNTRDLWGDEQSLAYPTPADTVTTSYGTFDGQSAFRGLGTARSLTATGNFYLSPFTTITLAATKNTDTPRPVPGLYGQPPYQLSLTVQTRPSKRFGLSLSRQYYFNFASLVWSPQTIIQFTP